jgi:hypothetical protein
MSKPDSGYFTGTSGQGKALIDEVIARGDKITPSEVIGIARDPNGKIVWLEKGHLGSNSSGLAHILYEHEDNFNRMGIHSSDIPDFVLTAVSKGEIIGYQGKGHSRPIYKVNYGGKDYKVAVTVGSNGYIVGANPKSSKE